MLANFRHPLPYFSVILWGGQKTWDKSADLSQVFRENKSTFFSMLRTFSKSSPEDDEDTSASWRITPHVGRKEIIFSTLPEVT